MKHDNFTPPIDFHNELIIDNFAGGGGTSTGLEAAFGRPVDIAINHNMEALAPTTTSPMAPRCAAPARNSPAARWTASSTTDSRNNK